MVMLTSQYNRLQRKRFTQNFLGYQQLGLNVMLC